MRKFLLAIIIMLLAPMYLSAARLKVYLREKDPNKKRELVMKPEVWYDTDERVMNWGYDGAGDNINYIACYKSLEDMKLEQQSGIVTDGYIYTEWAQYNRVEYCIYNIVEMP